MPTFFERSSSGWEKPKSAVIEKMESMGYIDSWKAAGGNSGAPSCWASTRIDVRNFLIRNHYLYLYIQYIWISPNFPMKPVYCKRVNSDASDHYPIIVHFKQ